MKPCNCFGRDLLEAWGAGGGTGPGPRTDCYFMVTNFRRLVQILERRECQGLVWKYHLPEGENHQSAVPAAVSRGLRFIYSSSG